MKKVSYYLILAIPLFIACKQHAQNRAKNDSANTKLADTGQNADSSEYIDWHSCKINGIIPSVSLIKDLYPSLGKPTRVSPLIAHMQGFYLHRKFKYIVIKNCLFELYGDTAVMKRIDFTTGLKFVTQNVTLDSNTTMASLHKIYPFALAHSTKPVVNDTEYDGIDLGIHNPNLHIVNDSNAHWSLLFRKSKLVELRYHPKHPSADTLSSTGPTL